MSKDPAFLFYSRDFYEGTRALLPEERACYLDLMIYQHQYHYIPADLNRVYMYCSGIDKSIVHYVLDQKFILTDYGYVNEKLNDVIQLREKHSEKQSTNGRLGQFYKRAKTMLNECDYYNLKLKLGQHENNIALSIACDFLKQPLKQPFTFDKAMLEALGKHLAIAINSNININNKIEKIENLILLCMADENWLRTLDEAVKIPIDKTLFALKDFNKHLVLSGKNEDKSLKEYKEYFVNWARKMKSNKN